MTNMTHEQLVEKVSKAICMVNCHNPDAVLTDNLDHSKWEIYAPDARAAISVIYAETAEPTEEMVKAGGAARHSAACDGGYSVVGTLNAESAYRAMHRASPLNPEGK